MSATAEQTPNPHEQHAREVKAGALASVLRAMPCPDDVPRVEMARHLSHAGQRHAAAVAGVHPPSRATWQRVVELLEQDDRMRARVLHAAGLTVL